MKSPSKDKIEQELKKSIQGEVRFDDGSRALYATDASNYRQVPIGVVIPKTIEDVIKTVEIARYFEAPLLSRGGGTSLAGQCCNTAIVMDFSKYLNRIVDLDPVKKIARIQPGLVLDRLREAAEKHHLTFGPDPSTHNHCTLGGMIGNNSCGVHSVMSGRTSDNVEELEILTYDGKRMKVGKTSEVDYEKIIREGGRKAEIYKKLKELSRAYADEIRKHYPDIPRRVSGYNLIELLPENKFNLARSLVGSEGTCAVILEATVRLIESPPCRSLLVLGYADVFSAADHIMEVMQHKPIGCEGVDSGLVNDMKEKGLHPRDLKLLPHGGGWLLVEFGGQTKKEADDHARFLMQALKRGLNPPSMKLYDDPYEEELVWRIRESGLGATAFVPGKPLTWEGWEDSAVPPEHLGNYLRDFRELLNKYSYEGDLYGHFGQGCLHTRINFDLQTAPGIKNFRSFLDEAADLVVSYGGSISGEHGDGQSKAELLPKMFGPKLIQAFYEFKSIWDPSFKMNPGKIVKPYRIDENLRLGLNYNPPHPETQFKFPDDRFSFARAPLRCVGVGECRKEKGGTMCPSYRATHEEKHSTRGRARLLFEMLNGEVLKKGWRDEHVKEALDLCLACKGCKGECPVNVDMATYKAEFLSHYYQGRLRPAAAYSMGLIHWWAGLASKLPNLANAVTQSRLFGPLIKKLGGISPFRSMPRFAEKTFRSRFKNHVSKNLSGETVILWVDTFNDHFSPSIAQAALEVLETLGYRVKFPQKRLCCGRPLYDFGMLDLGKRLLNRILLELDEDIRRGTPVVGLEPSCTAVFRDELVNLFPQSEQARRLSRQTFLLSEFLEKTQEGYPWPQLDKNAVVHGHCHQKALMGIKADQDLIKKLVAQPSFPDFGCCGMAGSFGFEKDHYKISIDIGEKELLPYIRQTDREDLIIANGFSCREQILSQAGRQPLHLSELILLSLREGSFKKPKETKKPRIFDFHQDTGF